MIPILYRSDETEFLSNGLGRLTECSECIVTEERNGIFELEFKYPITGRFYSYMINEGGIVAVIHDDKHDIQPFDIYSFSAPIDGIVTFNAHHISYRLGNIIVTPFEAQSCALVFDSLKPRSIGKNPFTFWTDKATAGTFTLTHPDNIRAILGGQEGSILDVYGTGEYEFDKYRVELHLNRGVDSGVSIRYGKNLSDIIREYDTSMTYNALAPYWTGTNGEVVYLPEYVVISPDAPMTLIPWTSDNGDYITDGNEIIYFQTAEIVPQALDMTAEFEDAPTVEELRQKALDFMANNQPWVPKENITIDFVQLWQTPEYENVANLQRVSLCDTVSIYYPELGVTSATAKIIKVVYNVLLERYDSMEIGALKTSLADYLKGDIVATLIEQPEFTAWQAAIQHATEMITGGLGGHVVMNLNANGEPQEILIMDTDKKETAVHVIRMNKNGIGFSNNGYNGPFESAWTIDGQFNASFIATGTLLANFIKGGTLVLGGLNDSNGVLSLQDLLGTEIVSMTNSGISVKQGTINLSQQAGGKLSTTTVSATGGLGTYRYPGLDQTASPEASVKIYQGTISMGGSSHDGVTCNLTQQGLVLYDYGESDKYVYMSVYSSSASLAGVSVTEYSLDGQGNSTYVGGSTMRSTRLQTTGNIIAGGTKSRLVKTEEFNKRLLYCYETPSPMFGDVGEGVIDETGTCYVFLDPVFAETISTLQYQVFLQRYGQGDCYVSERHPDYFIVKGEPGLSFGWELKAKQRDYDQLRLDLEEPDPEPKIDYGAKGQSFYEQLNEGRTA